MPPKQMKPCLYPRCTNLTRNVRCEKHTVARQEEKADGQRFYNKYKRDERSATFYQTKEWKRMRKHIFNKSHGLCDSCKERGLITPGNVVDHKLPMKTHFELRLIESNLWVMCHKCHNKKTAIENK